MTGKRAALARARKAAGLTQEEFAEKVGVDRSTVARWESSATAPLPYKRAKIANVLRMKLSDFEDLLAEEGSQHQIWDTLAKSSDSVIEIDLRIEIQIADDGRADVFYYHDVQNLSDLPLTRFRRDLWFENTSKRLDVTAIAKGKYNLMIQPIHFTTSMAKFACQIAPAVQPGESASFGYRCTNGLFVDQHYWRETITRYTRRFSIEVKQSGIDRLIACKATVEHPDGRENSAAEDLTWQEVDGSIALNLRQEFLQPNHAIALRWEIERRASA